jgi:hypothetical protein
MRKSALGVFVFLCFSSSAEAERAPVFEGAVIFSGGETKLDLTDALATVPLPPDFVGWTCYIDGTQRNGPAYFKLITCGGKWGFVDTFVSCDSKHRNDSAKLRLRQPIAGDKAARAAAEKVTIGVVCGY